MKRLKLLLLAAIIQVLDNSYATAKVSRDSTIVTSNQPIYHLSLTANPTTGYSWLLEHYSHHCLILLNHHYQAPTSTLIGAPGKDIWTFKVRKKAFIAPRLCKIKMIYSRLWDIKHGSKHTFYVLTH